MSDHLITSVVSVAIAIVGLAILAVLVSQSAQTGNVISAAGSAFAQDLQAATSPFSGSSSGFGGFTGNSPIASTHY